MKSFEFSSIHFSGRDENRTFTQLEQRGWLRITETLTSDGSQGLLSFMPKFEVNQSVMNPNVVYLLQCRRNRGAGRHVPPTFLEVAVVTLENNAVQKQFSLSCPPPPPTPIQFPSHGSVLSDVKFVCDVFF